MPVGDAGTKWKDPEVEPVIFPKPIAPVREPDRVRRSKSREDSRGRPPFAKHLRERQENSSGSFTGRDEEAGETGSPAVADTREEAVEPSPSEAAGDGRASKKLIDIRV